MEGRGPNPVCESPNSGLISARMANESIHEFVLAQLQLTKGDWPKVATATGIPYRTLKKIASGETADPGVSSVERLARYFRANPAISATA